MRWTEEQLRAIETRGQNVLLSAAAGSGKTTVLVARVLELIESGVDVNRMLIVTFTRAASADMRAKLQQELGKRAAEGDAAMRRQQLLLERASISTLHSFCADFLRTHFESANVDPAFRVLDDAEERRLADEALDEALEEFYTEPDEDALRLDYARGPKGVREMAEQLLRALDERPDPQRWLDAVCHPGEEMRRAWIDEMAGDARRMLDQARLYSLLALRHPECTVNYAEALTKDLEELERIQAMEDYDALQRAILEFKQTTPSRKGGGTAGEEVRALRDSAKKALGKIALRDLPLHTALDDMRALETEFHALGRLAMRARELFKARKAEIGALTYSDLEHRTLEALADPETARAVRDQYEYVFVDEYQDTSDVQEALIGRIVRGDNLFMVGDVKQSIYRFRQAEPRLFLEKYDRYARQDGGVLLPLTRNFRSRPAILDFVNRVFERAMRGGDSEIVYDEQARLNPGSEDLTGGSAELHLIKKPAADTEDPALIDLKDCEHEALFIAAKIRDMKAADPTLRFRDFAVLTRTKQGVLGKMAAILMQAGIPAFADGAEDFYDSVEISLALSLLKLVANRRSDIEWIGVLRSPLIALTDSELAQIRIAAPDVPFSDAIAAYAMAEDEIGRRLRNFMDLYEKWRLMALCTDLGVLCHRIFDESGLMTCAGALPGGPQRQANLLRLAENAAQFDRNNSGSLIRFVKHTEKLRDAGESGDAQLLGENDDVVRLMTVHKSKGLEFPVVFGALLSRSFSANPKQPSLTAHRSLGLGCKYCDPRLQTRRKTLSQAAIAAREKREDRAEELRILYVLLTRAEDHLILTASVKDPEAIPTRAAALRHAPGAANSALDVILAALEESDTRCPVIAHSEYEFDAPAPDDALRTEDIALDPELEAALLWKYPDSRAVGQPLKLTVTGILREIQSPDALEPLIARPAFLTEMSGQMRGTERGTAYHRAMQCLDLAVLRALNPRAMAAEIARQLDALTAAGRMNPIQRAAVSPSVIAGFLTRETGRRLCAAKEIHREWPFNVMMRISEALTKEEAAGYSEEEILVQGTIDCCFLESDTWILLDYKTDRSDDAEALTERYGDQLRLYALALERITGIRVAEIRLCLLAAGEDVIVETHSAK